MGTAETHLMTKLQAEPIQDQDTLYCKTSKREGAEERPLGNKEKGRAWVGGGGGEGG